MEILFLLVDMLFPLDLSSVYNLICHHHCAALITKFESKQRCCCDPFYVHETVKVFGRKVISLDLAKQLSILCSENIQALLQTVCMLL